MSRAWCFLLSLLVLSSIFSVSLAGQVSAHSANTLYFSNKLNGGDTYRFGDKLFMDGVQATTKEAFVKEIKGHYNGTISEKSANGSGRNAPSKARQKVAAMYIILSMLGLSETRERNVTPTQMQEWENRVMSDSIVMSVENYHYKYNTSTRVRTNSSGGAYYGSEVLNEWNIYKYSENANLQSVVFKNKNDNDKVVYALKVICGNPVGSLPGLPSHNFYLTPTITGDPSSVESDAHISLTPVVVNSGTTTSATAQWQVTNFTLNPEAPVPSGATNGITPANYFGNGAQIISGGSGSRTFPRGSPIMLSVPSQYVTAPATGSKVCYALSVQPVSHTSGEWRHSDPFCITVVRKPKVQVWGGDLLAGRVFTGHSLPVSDSIVETSISIKSDPQGIENIEFGSWIEYGIFAPNYVNGTASGSGLNSGSVAGQAGWSRLTFANNQTGSNIEPCASGAAKFGCFSVYNSAIPDIASNFSISSSTPRINGSVPITSLPRGLSTVSSADNNLTITGGVVNSGNWHVINAPNATVNITGDITYANVRLAKASDIPQLIIIAKDINITGNVRQVDAWLVALGGSVVTCSDRGNANDLRTIGVTSVPNAYKLSIHHCSNVLTINGPIMAESLWLRRTAGSGFGAASGDPAEIINLRPDAYLWAAEISKRTPRPQTVFIFEDAPRL